MSEKHLGELLRESYDSARRNEAVLQIHLFAIRYAEEITKNHYSVKAIAEAAGMPGYVAELSKGIKLAEYVEIKDTD